jgi:hypothetical protein
MGLVSVVDDYGGGDDDDDDDDVTKLSHSRRKVPLCFNELYSHPNRTKWNPSLASPTQTI